MKKKIYKKIIFTAMKKKKTFFFENNNFAQNFGPKINFENAGVKKKWKTRGDKKAFYSLREYRLWKKRNFAWQGKHWQENKYWNSSKEELFNMWFFNKDHWSVWGFTYKEHSEYWRKLFFRGFRGSLNFAKYLKGKKKTQIFSYFSNNKSWKLHQFSRLHAIRALQSRYTDFCKRHKKVTMPEKWVKQNKYKLFMKFRRWERLSNKWQIPLLFPARLFAGRKFVWYLRRKQILRKKKNRPYLWFNKTVAHRRHHGFKKKNFFRIRQLFLGKLILPLYGHLKKKQFLKIKAKAVRVRPTSITNSRSANFLGKFEKRLDVICFRLNVAPTIFWVRTFINLQLIFTSHFIENSISKKFHIKFSDKFPLADTFLKNQIPETFFVNKQKIGIKYFEKIPKIWKNKKSVFKSAAYTLPMPVTKQHKLVAIKSIVFFSLKHIKCLFFQKFFEKKIPGCFLYQKLGMSFFAYVYKQPQKKYISRFDRIKTNYLNWASL